MNKAFHFITNSFLSFSGNFFSTGHIKAKTCNSTVKETAKIISLQHYVAFSSIDVINREEEKTETQREAIIISFS